VVPGYSPRGPAGQGTKPRGVLWVGHLQERKGRIAITIRLNYYKKVNPAKGAHGGGTQLAPVGGLYRKRISRLGGTEGGKEKGGRWIHP